MRISCNIGGTVFEQYDGFIFRAVCVRNIDKTFIDIQANGFNLRQSVIQDFFCGGGHSTDFAEPKENIGGRVNEQVDDVENLSLLAMFFVVPLDAGLESVFVNFIAHVLNAKSDIVFDGIHAIKRQLDMLKMKNRSDDRTDGIKHTGVFQGLCFQHAIAISMTHGTLHAMGQFASTQNVTWRSRNRSSIASLPLVEMGIVDICFNVPSAPGKGSVALSAPHLITAFDVENGRRTRRTRFRVGFE